MSALGIIVLFITAVISSTFLVLGLLYLQKKKRIKEVVKQGNVKEKTITPSNNDKFERGTFTGRKTFSGSEGGRRYERTGRNEFEGNLTFNDERGRERELEEQGSLLRNVEQFEKRGSVPNERVGKFELDKPDVTR